MPKLPPKRALALGLALLLACASPPPPQGGRPTTGVFVIPNELPNGRVEITVAATYAIGRTATIPVSIVTTRGMLTGPLTARIMASGINEAHKPAEVLVRELVAVPIAVGANARGSTTLTWDTRDAKGDVVPADAYSLVLEVRSDDGGASRVLTAGATLELR
jgi:flagellar hook assembly protein FlgD